MQSMKEIIGKQDFIKIKSLCSSRQHDQSEKSNHRMGSAKDISDKEIIVST